MKLGFGSENTFPTYHILTILVLFAILILNIVIAISMQTNMKRQENILKKIYQNEMHNVEVEEDEVEKPLESDE